MKYIIKTILFVVVCLLAFSCQKDDDEIIIQNGVSPESSHVTFSNEKGSSIFNFSVSGDWTAAVAENASSWCRINKTSGQSGNNTIEISVEENNTYDERNASITIICGKVKEIVTVTQKQKNALILESNKVEVKEEGGSITLTIKSNLKYSCEIDESCQTWIHSAEPKTRSLTTSVINLQIDANQELSNREGKIYITAGELYEEVTIYQDGATPKVVISNKDIIVSSSEETIKIEVASNTEYEYILPKVSWIYERQTRAMSTYTHYFTIAENNTYDQRTAEIQFINKTTGEIEVVKVSQMQRDAIIVAQNTYNLDGEETLLDFVINTNVDFETNISDDWVQTYERVTTRALTQRTLSFRIGKNPQTTERTATITFVYEDIKQTVTIVQDGRTDKMKISITHSETEFSTLELEGNNISRTVNWGDGSQTDITKGHSYEKSNTKTANFETMGVNKFRIKNLNSISSITIYCNEGKNGSTEDFNIENKDWD